MTKAVQHQVVSAKKTLKLHAITLAMCTGLMFGLNIETQAQNINPPSLRSDAPNVYIVKKGDTLWDISGHFLNKPWRWPEIWASNKHIKNPHWIYPGDRLLLCSLNGQPLIGKDEGDGCDGIIRRSGGQTGINLAPQVRVESLNNAIPVIPLDSIRVWLERTIVVSPKSIANLPYVLGMTENRVIAAAGDQIYVRGQGIKVGQRYAVYRVEEPYKFRDTQGKEYVVGIELNQIASGLATQIQDDISTFELDQTYNAEVRKGDLILPEYDAMLPTLFYPVPANEVRSGGEIIRVLGSIGTAGKHSVVAINRGLQDGAKDGQVFAIHQQGEIMSDPKTKEKIQLPNQRIGHAMIFRTFDNVSYAYVTDSSLPIKLGAIVTAPLSDE